MEKVNKILENEKQMLVRKTTVLKSSRIFNSPESRVSNEHSKSPKVIGSITTKDLITQKSKIIVTDKIKAYKNIVEEITSDIYSDKVNDEISDCTSFFSTGSRASLEMKVNSQIDPKKIYQEFVKLTLKIKFEKLHNSHKGHEIPEKALFRECSKLSIPRKEWFDFIFNELQNTKKYEKFLQSKKKIASRVYS